MVQGLAACCRPRVRSYCARMGEGPKLEPLVDSAGLAALRDNAFEALEEVGLERRLKHIT
jgi:hypothetical protein